MNSEDPYRVAVQALGLSASTNEIVQFVDGMKDVRSLVGSVQDGGPSWQEIAEGMFQGRSLEDISGEDTPEKRKIGLEDILEGGVTHEDIMKGFKNLDKDLRSLDADAPGEDGLRHCLALAETDEGRLQCKAEYQQANPGIDVNRVLADIETDGGELKEKKREKEIDVCKGEDCQHNAACDPNCPCTNTHTEVITQLGGKKYAETHCSDCKRIVGRMPLGANVNSDLKALAELGHRLDVVAQAVGDSEAGALSGKSLEEAIDGSLTGKSLETIFEEA